MGSSRSASSQATLDWPLRTKSYLTSWPLSLCAELESFEDIVNAWWVVAMVAVDQDLGIHPASQMFSICSVSFWYAKVIIDLTAAPHSFWLHFFFFTSCKNRECPRQFLPFLLWTWPAVYRCFFDSACSPVAVSSWLWGSQIFRGWPLQNAGQDLDTVVVIVLVVNDPAFPFLSSVSLSSAASFIESGNGCPEWT